MNLGSADGGVHGERNDASLVGIFKISAVQCTVFFEPEPADKDPQVYPMLSCLAEKNDTSLIYPIPLLDSSCCV